MKSRIRLALLVLALTLAGCSDEATHLPATPTGAAASGATPAPVTDQTLRARIGMVFTDSDPWMAGAALEQGTLRVGDRVFLRTNDDSTIAVTITAIRDDATQTDVTEAAAPQGVFLSFKPFYPESIQSVESGAMLVGDVTRANQD
jgi:hypothetical protein